MFNYSEHSPRCFASGQQGISKNQLKIWKATLLFWRKSWMAREFSCTDAGTNIFIVQGLFLISENLPSLVWFRIRKGKDYSYLYGSHVGTGSLTPYIDAAFDKRIERSAPFLLNRTAKWTVFQHNTRRRNACLGSSFWKESTFWDTQDSGAGYVLIMQRGGKHSNWTSTDKSKKELNPRPCCKLPELTHSYFIHYYGHNSQSIRSALSQRPIPDT